MNWEREKKWKYESLKCSIEWKTGQCESRALVQYLFLINFLNCRAYQCWCDVLLLMLCENQTQMRSTASSLGIKRMHVFQFSRFIERFFGGETRTFFHQIMMTTSTMMMMLMLMAIYWHSNCLSSINGASTSTGAIIAVSCLLPNNKHLCQRINWSFWLFICWAWAICSNN